MDISQHVVQYRRDKMALRTTCIKYVKFTIITRTDCQYVGYLYYIENLNWTEQNDWATCDPRVGHS